MVWGSRNLEAPRLLFTFNATDRIWISSDNDAERWPDFYKTIWHSLRKDIPKSQKKKA